jgi:hypothetical protein
MLLGLRPVHGLHARNYLACALNREKVEGADLIRESNQTAQLHQNCSISNGKGKKREASFMRLMVLENIFIFSVRRLIA